MATPNYSFEKRKREQAKKAAKEAKRLRKDAKLPAAEAATLVEESACAEATADNPAAAEVSVP